MNIKDVSEIIVSNIHRLKTEKFYRNIISMNNNLIRFDYLNRIIIAIQCENAFDVRTFDEWSQSKRSVINTSNKISIVYPISKTVYIDTKTNEVISQSDLNVNELPFAIKYGIVRKEENLNSIEVIYHYDIRNTYCKENTDYKIDKHELSSSKLLEVAQEILGCNIEKGEMLYFSSSKNILYVNDVQYTELAEYIIELLINHYKNNILDTTKVKEYCKDLLFETMKYSLGTLFHIDVCCDFQKLKATEIEDLMNILSINDQEIELVSSILSFNNKSLNGNAIKNLNVKRKASAILDLMEANEEYLKIKGK